jgi:hypothetical protein
VGFTVGNVALGRFFSKFSVSPVDIIPPWLSIIIYHLGDMNVYRSSWGQFLDMDHVEDRERDGMVDGNINIDFTGIRCKNGSFKVVSNDGF